MTFSDPMFNLIAYIKEQRIDKEKRIEAINRKIIDNTFTNGDIYILQIYSGMIRAYREITEYTREMGYDL